jgi:hypothetical protein
MSEQEKAAPPELAERGLADIALGAAVASGVSGVVGTVAVHATNKVINRPPKEPDPPSQVLLPDGVSVED